jgi:hypothetical protein
MNDPQRDEELAMGEHALFVEHPTDGSNRIKVVNVKSSELPWKDTTKLPYQVTGPYLSELFAKAFIDGLHAPQLRPSADDWETALVKTVDLLQPCANPACEQQWYVFDNKAKPCCPFCGTAFQGPLPVLNLYSSQREGSFRPDNHRLMVYSGQSLLAWHINKNVAPNEKLADAHKKRVGYFVLHQDVWYLVNEGMPHVMDVGAKTPVPIGGKVALEDGRQLLLSREPGGRLVVVQMANQ